MNSEMKKEILCRSEEKEKLKCEKSIETDLVLPDYCADIKRILKCTVVPGIHSVSTSSDRVTVKGTAVIRLIYADDKERIDCYEKSVEISVGGQLKNPSADAVVVARAAADYVNCRAVSRRKVSVSSGVSIICSLKSAAKQEIICEAQQGIESKKEKRREASLVCQCEKTFDMSETVVLDKEKPPMGKILRHHAYVTVESQKAVEGKLLIKGELTVKVVYCPSESENKTEKLIHKMPISQIIDIEGIDQDCEIRTLCNINQLLTAIKSDSSQSGRLLEVSARVSAFVCGYKTKEYEFICDCYCTSGEHKAEYSSKDVLTKVYSDRRIQKLKQSLSVSPVKEIADVWVSEKVTSVSASQSKAQATVKLTLCILGFDEKGNPAYAEKVAEFLSETDLSESYERPQGEFLCDVRDVSWGAVNQGNTEICAEVMTDIKILNAEKIDFVCAIKKEKSEICTVRPALTLYYSQKGEKIWDIAKKYSTTVKAVLTENGIDGETVPEDKLLMIPCV